MPAPSSLWHDWQPGPWPAARRAARRRRRPPPPLAAVADGAPASPPSSPPHAATPSATAADEQQGGKAATDHDGESRSSPACAIVPAPRSPTPGSAACHHDAQLVARDAVRGVDGGAAAGHVAGAQAGHRLVERTRRPRQRFDQARTDPQRARRQPGSRRAVPRPHRRDRRGEHGRDVVDGDAGARAPRSPPAPPAATRRRGRRPPRSTRVWLATSTLGTSSRSTQRRIGGDSAATSTRGRCRDRPGVPWPSADPSSSVPGSISPLVSSGGPVS